MTKYNLTYPRNNSRPLARKLILLALLCQYGAVNADEPEHSEAEKEALQELLDGLEVAS